MKLREMLELAALAVGYRHVDYSSCDYDGALGIVLLDENGGQGKNWSPHTDDGDSRRLEVALKLSVCVCDEAVIVEQCMGSFQALEKLGLDPLAATRMAVLRCAAEIGKSMKEKSK